MQERTKQESQVPDFIIHITTTPPAADAKPVVVKRLVRAGREASAIAHVVADTIKIDRATTEDIIACAEAGVRLEKAE